MEKKKQSRFLTMVDTELVDKLYEYYTLDEHVDIWAGASELVNEYIRSLISEREKAKQSEHEEEA